MIEKKANRFGVILVAIFSITYYGCGLEKKTTRLLQDNTLLYSIGGKETIYGLIKIVEVSRDSIYDGYARCRSLEEWYYLNDISNGASSLDVPFQSPYLLKKKGSRIVLHYKEKSRGSEKQRIYVKDQYSLNKQDSITSTHLEFLCNQEMGYSKYLGDTILTVANLNLKCLVFREFYLRSRLGLRDMTVTRYLEKSTLVPILIDTDFYEGKGFTMAASEENESYTILTSIIPRDSLRKRLTYKTRYCP